MDNKKFLTIFEINEPEDYIRAQDLYKRKYKFDFFKNEDCPLKIGHLLEVTIADNKVISAKQIPLESLPVQSYILYQPDFMHASENASFRVTLERRGQRDGPDRWGIYQSGSVLQKKEGLFGYESMPSSRTEAELNNTRFKTPQDAWTFWKQVAEEVYIQDLKDRIALMQSKHTKK